MLMNRTAGRASWMVRSRSAWARPPSNRCMRPTQYPTATTTNTGTTMVRMSERPIIESSFAGRVRRSDGVDRRVPGLPHGCADTLFDVVVEGLAGHSVAGCGAGDGHGDG